MSTEKITVLCVDDSEDIARAICRAAALEPDLQALPPCTDAAHLAGAVAHGRPDVVLLDLTMPGADPERSIRLAASTGARVVVFSGYDDPETRRMVHAAGATGFVSKHADLPAIFAAIRIAARGVVRDGLASEVRRGA